MPAITQPTALVSSGHALTRRTDLAIRDYRELFWGEYELFWGDYRLAWGDEPLFGQPTALVSSGHAFARATTLT